MDGTHKTTHFIISDETELRLKNVFKRHCSVLNSLYTEKNIFGLLKSKGFIEPELYRIGSALEIKLVGNE